MKALLAGLATLVCAAPALAVAEDVQTREITVSADADDATVREAITTAARAVCARAGDATLADRAERKACVETATADALAQAGLASPKSLADKDSSAPRG